MRYALLFLLGCGGNEPRVEPAPTHAHDPPADTAEVEDASTPDAEPEVDEPDATSTLTDTDPAPPLPDGLVVRGEPDDRGGAVLVIENNGTRAIRLGSGATVVQEADVGFFHLENVTISLNPSCADEPECITLRPGQRITAERWEGTQGPAPQCRCPGCRHVGSARIRFVAYRCNGEPLPSATFLLGEP